MKDSSGVPVADEGYEDLQLIGADAAAATVDDRGRAEARHARIALAAYLRAEARGFGPGEELEDWLVAERKVDGEGGVTAA